MILGGLEDLYIVSSVSFLAVEDLPGARVLIGDGAALSPAGKDLGLLSGVNLVESGLGEHANLLDIVVATLKVSFDVLAELRDTAGGHTLLVRRFVPCFRTHDLFVIEDT